MSSNPWHKRYHSDALNGYMGLSLEERGAYTTLLDLMYQSGEPVVDNERLIAGWMQVSLRRYRILRDKLIVSGKIIRLADGRLTNARFQKERENSSKTSRKRAENGSRGGVKSAEVRKKRSVINVPGQQELQQRSSYTRAFQKPEAREEPDGSYSDPDGSGANAPPDIRKELFDEGIRSLIRQTGKPDSRCRALIGKWLKASRDDCRVVLTKIRQAEVDRVADPVPWIGEAIKPGWSTDPVERQMRQSF